VATEDYQVGAPKLRLAKAGDGTIDINSDRVDKL
jgi:hypothetical protein